MRLVPAVFVLCALSAATAAPCLASVAVVEDQVVFRLANDTAQTVYLVGDFNGWNPTIDQMERTAGGFEISLYLLPGTYSYGYVADGASTSDPENPCVDPQGRSCFTLVQTGGKLEVVLAEQAGTAGAAGGPGMATMSPVAAADLLARKGDVSSIGILGLRGTIDDRVDVDLSAGFTGSIPEGGTAAGRTYLAHAEAVYRLDRGSIGVFARPNEIVDLADSARIIGVIGPCAYPVSLFSRGVFLKAALPAGLDLTALYLSRLRGYSTGLEGKADTSSLFSRRDLEDADTYAFAVGARRHGASARYLYRQDRRVKDGYWRFPGGDPRFHVGYERDEFQGFSLAIEGDAGFVWDCEALWGRSFLDATGILLGPPEDYPHDVLDKAAPEQEWEHGTRLVFEVARREGEVRPSLRFERTTLEGSRAARDGRQDGRRASLAARLALGDSARSLVLHAKGEQYSASNTGSIFWLSRTNFWLDGDEVTYDLVPFLSSKGIYELGIECEIDREPIGSSPWETGFGLAARQRGDVGGPEPLFREARLSGGVTVHSRIALLLDLRGASYRHAGMKRDFADAFFGVHGTVTKGLWCLVGAGVSPINFDPWQSIFCDDAREDYLYARGVYEALASGGEAASVKALLDAEDAMAEDWAVMFEAGFAF